MVAYNLNMDIFKAMADPIRRDILACLKDQPKQSINALTKNHQITRQAVTKHLNILVKSGLVQTQMVGKQRLHQLNAEPLKQVADWLKPYAALWDQRLANLKTFLGESDEA